jgi:protein gp37
MADGSAIEWTEATWNPTTGCDRLSAGCDHCYALTLAKRLKAMGAPKYQNDGDPRTSGPGFGVAIHPDALRIPYGWRGPRVVFVNSMSDLSGRVTILKLASPQLRGREFGIKRVRQVSWTGGLAR